MKLEGKWYTNRKFLVALILIVIIAVVGTVWAVAYDPKCLSYDCFQKQMKICSGSTFVNDQPEATWKYKIVGREGRECKIDVTLLQAKKGELGISGLEGYSMQCFYSIGTAAYPERDLSKCHGRLKEELQAIVIEKLHTHILENLGEFDESLRGVL